MSDRDTTLPADQSVHLPGRRFWIEKTIVKDRADRKTGEHSLGKALWSPQTSKNGADIYPQMREVKSGDIIFHLIDNEKFSGYSTAHAAVTDFVGVDGTDWANRKSYRIQLEDYTVLTPEIERSEILGATQYRPLLEKIRTTSDGVFYNVLFNLREGAYLTEAPIQLVQILNNIYIAKTGHPINAYWHVPPLNNAAEVIHAEDLRSILERYYKEKIIFSSSSKKQRYSIVEFDSDKVSVERLDARAPQPVTFSQAEKLIQRVKTEKAVIFSTLDSTSAVRNTVLQEEQLALSADREQILYIPDNESRLQNFLEVLDKQKKSHPLYKPAMLLCVLEGVESGDLAENKIPFEWIAPRFIKKLKELGENVSENTAAQPYYHLASDLIWLHAVYDIHELMEDGREGAAAALGKIKYALLKDTYWNLLQDSQSRSRVIEKLRNHISAATTHSVDQLKLLSTAMFTNEDKTKLTDAVKATGFQAEDGFVDRVLDSLVAKPFLILTGNSGTGKTKLAELVAARLSGEDAHVTMAIGAGWTDNRNVVGFVNFLRSDSARGQNAEGSPLMPLYQSTPILDLLLRADKNPADPHFLILDEMNLSHVERYFADFLSAMESTKGLIHLHSEGDEETLLSLLSGEEPVVPRRLAFPPNVFVIGTVNVDETTYMFSPKVLDRANVIEFRTGETQIEEYLSSSRAGVSEISPGSDSERRGFLQLAKAVRSATLEALDADTSRRIGEALTKVFNIMAEARLEFGFRTIKEVLAYHAADFALTGNKAEWNWESVFDLQLLQKVLPKLHGSKRRLEPLLLRLAGFCETGAVPAKDAAYPDDLSLSGGVKYPLCRAKLVEMIEAVRRDQFVSFIH
jgi:hypothetical protein